MASIEDPIVNINELGARYPLVPWPHQLEPGEGSLRLSARSRVVLGVEFDAVPALVGHLVADVQRATGLHLQVTTDAVAAGDVELQLLPALAVRLGPEGYELTIDEQVAVLRAGTLHGLWHATRTLVQLFPHEVGHAELPVVRIVDRPRFEWRGAMLDVARHFFSVDHVLRFIELMARFKLNRLHLHLTDDQGWRLAIDGWPALTDVGAASCAGGGFGGHFSRADYREIVAHAAHHYITVVPEIDMPGHTNAALSSVAQLNVDGVAAAPYTGTGVGFSSLRLAAPATEQFVRDVIAQLAADTPGEYLHIGGDEAHVTDPGEYAEFLRFVQQVVHHHGKRVMGWEEIATTPLAPGTLVQHWLHPAVAAAASPGTRFVMSPARHTYLDMKHTPNCPVGRRWAGFIDLDTIYGWNPAAVVDGVGDERIAGVEAPLWTEKVITFDQVEYLCFPRLACLAEVGWTPQDRRDWGHARPRLLVHTQRLAASGVRACHSALLD